MRGGGWVDCFRIDLSGLACLAKGVRFRSCALGELRCPARAIRWYVGIGVKPTRFAAPVSWNVGGDCGEETDLVLFGFHVGIRALSTSLLSSRNALASSTASVISRGGVGGRVGKVSNTLDKGDDIAEPKRWRGCSRPHLHFRRSTTGHTECDPFVERLQKTRLRVKCQARRKRAKRGCCHVARSCTCFVSEYVTAKQIQSERLSSHLTARA